MARPAPFLGFVSRPAAGQRRAHNTGVHDAAGQAIRSTPTEIHMRDQTDHAGIPRRQFVKQLGAAGAALAAGTAAGLFAQEATPRRPNIIFLLADDMRWDAMGCMGNRFVRTPHLDRLAAQGVLFENAFVTTSICAPNRACVLAGQHQRTTGIKDFSTPFEPAALDQTYPVLLRNAGYRTGFMGKWGVGARNSKVLELPASRFDYWRGFPGQGQYFHDVDGKRVHLTTDLVPRQTREFLDGCRPGQPFCLSISFKAPHGPWRDFDPALVDLYTGKDTPALPKTFTKEAFDALPEFLRTSLNGLSGPATDERWALRRDRGKAAEQVAQYYRLTTGIDIAVGKIVAELERRSLDQNTVIILTSDNGHFLFEQGLAGKWLMYEQSIRVPLLVYDPRLPAALRGTRRGEMALTIDMAPTILTMAGAPVPEAMQGVDLTPLLYGKRVPWRTDWFYEHTFTLAPPRLIARSQGVRTERWKYVRYLDTNPNYEQLFDLGSDPDELSNLAGDPAHEAVLNRLRERLLHYRRTLPDNNPEPQEYGHFRMVALSTERGDTAHDLGACQSLGQTFLTEGVKLHSLRFRTPTWGKKPAPCGLIVELLADGPRGKLLSTQAVARQSIRNNGLCRVRFDLPLRLGQPVYLRIRPEEAIPAQRLGVWRYDESFYLDGSGRVDDEPREFDLELDIRYEDPEGFVPPKRKWDPPKRRKYKLRQGQVLPLGQQPQIAGKAISIKATIRPVGANGVIVAHGGRADGYSLYIKNGRLAMATRHNGKLTLVVARSPLPKGEVEVAGRLTKDGTITLEVAGSNAASGKAPGPIRRTPGDPLMAGGDHQTPVGEYAAPSKFPGVIRSLVVRVDD